MYVSKFSHCPLTTTTTSPFTSNGKKFQTTLDSATYVNGVWVQETEYVNCGQTEYRRLDSNRRYGVTYSDGSHQFLSRTAYNALRHKAGLSYVGV